MLYCNWFPGYVHLRLIPRNIAGTLIQPEEEKCFSFIIPKHALKDIYLSISNTKKYK